MAIRAYRITTSAITPTTCGIRWRVPPDSRLGLEKTIELLHRQSGAIETRPLPTLKLFKIGVKLNLGGDDIATRSEAPRFSEEESRAGGGLQGDG